MKKPQFYFLVVWLIVLHTSGFTYAQEIDEDDYLAFQEHFFEALKYKAIGSSQKAIESLEKCYQIDSTNVALYFEFSKNHLDLKNYFEAEYFIKKALKKKAANIWFLEHLKEIYKKQFNLKDAILIQHKIVKLNPKKKEDLILLYIQHKDFQLAIEIIEEIEEGGIMSNRLKDIKNYLLNRNQIREEKIISEENLAKNKSITALKKTFSDNKDFQILQKIVLIEQESKLYEDLIKSSSEGILYFPAQPLLYKMKGLALNKLGKYKDALKVLNIGIDFVIDNVSLQADYFEQFAISYKGLNQIEKSNHYQQKADELRKKITQ